MGLLRQLLTGNMCKGNNYRTQIQEHNSVMVFVPMGSESKLSTENDPYSFCRHYQIYHSIIMLYPNKAYMRGIEQLHNFDSAETTI
jgi:hypothetical protein